MNFTQNQRQTRNMIPEFFPTRRAAAAFGTPSLSPARRSSAESSLAQSQPCQPLSVALTETARDYIMRVTWAVSGKTYPFTVRGQ